MNIITHAIAFLSGLILYPLLIQIITRFRAKPISYTVSQGSYVETFASFDDAENAASLLVAFGGGEGAIITPNYK